jgi:hypothetical protein
MFKVELVNSNPSASPLLGRCELTGEFETVLEPLNECVV